jgi:hypothetical protein
MDFMPVEHKGMGITGIVSTVGYHLAQAHIPVISPPYMRCLQFLGPSFSRVKHNFSFSFLVVHYPQ